MNKFSTAPIDLAIPRKSLVDQTAEALMNAILEGVIPVGSRLVEARLEAELGVSRTPLREAFRTLEQHGFVTLSPNKGAYVRQIELIDMLEVSEVRSTLEALAICLMRQRMTPEMLGCLDVELAAMEEAYSSGNSLDFIAHHNRYHEIIIEESGNRTLIEILTRLRAHTNWHRFYFQYDLKEFFEGSLSKHLQVHQLLRDPSVTDEELCQVEKQTAKESCDRLASFISSNQSS